MTCNFCHGAGFVLMAGQGPRRCPHCSGQSGKWSERAEVMKMDGNPPGRGPHGEWLSGIPGVVL